MEEFSWKQAVRPFFAGRKFLISHSKVEYLRTLVEELHELGADQPFVLAGAAGSDLLEDLDVAGVAELGRGPFASVMDELRTTYAAFDDLPDDVQGRIDAWDPGKEAQVLSFFLQVATPLAGREHYGTRLPEWMVLDDKTTVDDVWKTLAVDHAPCVVVDLASHEALLAAFAEVASKRGAVLAADNAGGWHGGAERTRWVQTPGDCLVAAEELATQAQQVRVMPYLEGIPCGITGIVFRDRVVALRPAEMLIVRFDGRFEYAGTATVWKPSSTDVAAMRRLVKRVGVYLRQTLAYRGFFTIDGVVTVDGFLPTEMNPRMGGAAGRIDTGIDVSLRMIDRVLIAGEDVDLRPAVLERSVLDASSHPDVAQGFLPVPTVPTVPIEMWWDGSAVVPSQPDGASAAVEWIASRGGGEIRITCDADLLRDGAPFAPVLVQIAKTFAAACDIDLGRLEAARSVRESVTVETIADAVRLLAAADIGEVERRILREALEVNGQERLLALREALVRTRNAWEALSDRDVAVRARSAIATGKLLGIDE